MINISLSNLDYGESLVAQISLTPRISLIPLIYSIP